MEKSEILSEILRVADELDESPSVPQFNERADFTHIVAVEEFGSWNDAKKNAGLEVTEKRAASKSKHNIVRSLKVEKSCQLCNESCYATLTYHHVNKEDKVECVTEMIRQPYKKYDREDVIEEINKCALICSNCHSKIHSKIDIDIPPGGLETLNV